MKTNKFFLFAIIFPFLLSLEYAFAKTKRSALSLTECVALADYIVVGRVSEIDTIETKPSEDVAENHMARIELHSSLKGSLSEKEINVRYFSTHRKPMPIVLEKNDSYILFLYKKIEGEDGYRFPNQYDGAILYNQVILSEISSILEKSLFSPWKKNSKGLRAKILADKRFYEIGEDINLKIFLLNSSNSSILLNFSDLPLEKHSHCSLEIKGPKGLISGKPIDWLSRKEIEEYFSKYMSRQYEVKLTPGRDYVISLAQINTAPKGWGYKEWLDFKYYPLVEAGEYSISAEVRNISDAGPIETSELNLWLYPKEMENED